MENTQPTEDSGLVNSISKEISDNSIDLSIEYAEIGLDSFVGEGILREIPFLRTLYSIGKIGMSIKERHFVKKLLVFLKEFHSASIDQSKLNDFKFDYNTDYKYREKITEQVIIYIDSFLHIEKAKILANLFNAHIEKKYDWNHFIYLSTVLNSIHPYAIEYLGKIAAVDFNIPEKVEDRKIPRNPENEALLMASGLGYEHSSWGASLHVSQLGKDLYNYGIARKS